MLVAATKDSVEVLEERLQIVVPLLVDTTNRSVMVTPIDRRLGSEYYTQFCAVLGASRDVVL